MSGLDLVRPETLAEALAALSQYGDDARVIAGGTAVVLMLRQRLIEPAVLVSIGQLPGLDYIRAEADGSLRIGALTRLRAVERSPWVAASRPELHRAFSVVANVRIRNAATVGGNLAEADYASDPPAVLVMLDATVRLAGAGGERTLPLSDFFQGFYTTALRPGELVTELQVPPPPAGARATYLKFKTRSSEDRPCLGVAALVAQDADGRCLDLRVAVGAASDRPQRFAAIEQQARGERLTAALVEHVAASYAQSIEPIGDLRGSSWYRRRMIQVFVRRALAEVGEVAR